jgi:hypothetical protein
MKNSSIGIICFSLFSLLFLWKTSTAIPENQIDRQEGKNLLSRICSQCHALSIEGVCVAGNCEVSAEHPKETSSREWAQFLKWLRDGLQCPINRTELSSLTNYLNAQFPPPPKPHLLSWQQVYKIPGAWNVVSLNVVDGYLYAGVEGKGAEIHRTGDGEKWFRVAKTDATALYGIMKFNGFYFAGGNEPVAQIFRSENGTSWKRAAILKDQDGVISLGSFHNALYAGTTGGEVYRSEDGTRWDRVVQIPTRGEPNWVRSLTEFKGQFYAVAEQGDIYRTTDGHTWTGIQWLPSYVTNKRRLRPAEVFHDTLYIGTTTHGEVWKSNDGEVWEIAFNGPSQTKGGYVGSLKSTGKNLLAGVSVGFGSGKVYQTSEGRTWEEIGLLSPHTIESLAFFNGAIYAGTLTPPDTLIFRTSLSR